jgi:hypothetical protein
MVFVLNKDCPVPVFPGPFFCEDRQGIILLFKLDLFTEKYHNQPLNEHHPPGPLSHQRTRRVQWLCIKPVFAIEQKTKIDTRFFPEPAAAHHQHPHIQLRTGIL